MKSFFRTFFITTLLLGTHQVFAQQLAWPELPEIPANPTAGQTSPQSYDVMIADDGRVYASYIFNDGTNYKIYFQEYVSGSGWNALYNEVVYSGFEAIHSYTYNGSIYVLARVDDAVSNPIMRIYKISAGMVSLINNVQFSDLADGAEFRSVMSENGNYIYLLHKNVSNTSLSLTQLNISGGVATSLTVPTGAASAYNYDLIEHQDTVYLGLTRDEIAGQYRTYLHKAASNMAAVIPHHPGNVDGQMGGVGPNSALMGLAMGKNFTTHSIRILTSSSPSNNFIYNFDPATLTTTFPNVTLSYTPQADNPMAAVNLSQSTVYFGGMLESGMSTYHMGMIQDDYSSSSQSLFSDLTVLSGQLNTNYRLSFSETAGKGVASYYDADQAKQVFWHSNHLPTATALGNPHTICPMSNSLVMDGLELSDPDGSAITIVDITAADQAMFPAGSLTASSTGQVGNDSFFDIYGNATTGGSTLVTVTFSDGVSTQTIQFPVNVIQATIPSFNTSSVSVCSNNGMLDFSEYVSQTGGTFNIGGISADFNGMFFNSNTTGIAYESQLPLTYTILSMGCSESVSVPFTFHQSPIVAIATLPTTCGGNSGSATATVSGSTTPYSGEIWSSGETATTSVNGLGPGTYTFAVQGANACSTIKQFTIVPTGVDIVPTITNATCYGSNDGAISTTLTGFTAPTTMIWSSGHSSSSISNMVPGTYTLTVTDASNCIYTEAFTITQPTQITASTTVNNPTCGNNDGTMQVVNVAGGSGTYNYNWSTGGTSAMETNVGYGVYSATITDNTGCQIIKTVYVSEQNSGNLTGVITGSQCGSSNGGIDVTPMMSTGTSVQSILWSNGQTTEDMVSATPGNYVCTLTTDANCHAVKGWDIPIVSPDVQPICVITVDSATSTNLVVWEKVQPIGIHHYNIYRETSSQGEYILIDTVEATNLSLFNDVVASPIDRSWSYKISAVNGCNVEGPLSPQHRTMHLSAYNAGSSQTAISWNAYEGTAYSSFILSRYTDALGWEVVTSLPTSQTTYTDNTNFATPGLDYMVELDLDQQCTPMIYKAQDFNTTRSNKDKGAFSIGVGTGDSNNGVEELLLNQVQVYPNPTTGMLAIEQSKLSQLTITVTDLTGKKLMTSTQTGLSSNVNISNLETGTYIVELMINNTKRIERIVKL